MFSSQVVIGDILPYTQATATGGQTVFGTNWTANASTDVVVYQTPSGDAPNDETQILMSSDYTVAFIGGSQQVQVTLITPASAGDIITITRQTPADRENLYSNTNFTPTMLNQDFGILTLVDQQAQLVNQLIGPRYNYSAVITDVVDTILPILGANEAWVMNSSNTGITTFEVPASGIAPAGDTYVLLTPDSSNLPNSFSLSTLGTGILINVPGDESISLAVVAGTVNQITVANGNGIGGTIGLAIAANPIMPGTAGMGVPSGTTGQRIVPVSNINLRYNTTLHYLEYYADGDWNQLTTNNIVEFGTQNSLAWYAATGTTVSPLATANDAVLITSAGGVPSLSQTIPLAVQLNITEVGTLTQGIWNASAVTVPYGGTGLTTTTAYGVICGGTTATGAFQNAGAGTLNYILQSQGAAALPVWTQITSVLDLIGNVQGDVLYRGASAWAALAPGTAGQIFQTGGAAANPAWSTAVYPSTTTINQLLYSSSSNVVTGLPTAQGSVLVTDGVSTPAWLANPSAANRVLFSTNGGAPFWSNSSFPTAAGAVNTILISDGTNYINSTSLWPNTVGTSGTILRSNGTNNVYSTSTFADTYAVNTILFASSANTITGLATANSSVLVTSAGGVPSLSSTLPNIDIGTPTAGILTNCTGLPLTTGVTGTLPILNGGTGVTSVTTSPTASAWAGWDANRNFSADNFISGYTTTATAAGTTTLTVDSTYQQYFTGSTTQTVTMPVVSTLVLGQMYKIVNNSSGNVTVQSSGANSIQVMASGSTAYLTCILTSGTDAASWAVNYDFNSASSGTVNIGTTNQLAYYAGNGNAVSGYSPGTGVLTALGVNVGTAGAFVVNGGALGTPSSGTLTNCSGLPVSGVAASNSVTSSSSGNFTGTSATMADITNLTCTITTTGRPVLVILGGDSDNTHAGGWYGNATGVQVQVVRDGTAISPQIQAFSPGGIVNSLVFVDPAPSAASHTYKIQYLCSAGTFSCPYMKLTVSEML